MLKFVVFLLYPSQWQIVEGMFEPTTSGNAQGMQMLGLYGTGGVGKTTICKALCNHFRFQGRVCHVELGPREEHLDLQKKVLKKLTNLGDQALQGITDSDQVRYQNFAVAKFYIIQIMTCFVGTQKELDYLELVILSHVKII